MKLNSILRVLALSGVAGLWAPPQPAFAQPSKDVRRITLSEAVHVAISQNHALKIARLKVTENEQKKAGQRSAYFPSITNQSNLIHITDLENIGIPAGAFGTAGGSLVPSRGIIIPQGQKTLYSSGTQISQPLTQLIRIHRANQIAAAEVAVSRDDLKTAETQVALQVHTLYFGILIARLQKQAAEQQSTYATERLRESEDDVRNGSALTVAAIQGKAGLLESRQSVLTAELQLSDLNTELNDLLGLPLDTQLDLDAAVPSNFELRPRAEYVQTAWAENPEIL
ncbi:MAG: TolC family protein, partial [Acidobacteriia bacterium]|nr:TolC family protein [Terriglobia bacterium]